jgi:ABC-2 type transport system permease protein
MQLHRIWGLFLRYYYNLLRTYDRLTDVFFWPIVDLVLWGLTSRFVAGSGVEGNLLFLSLIGGIILWIFPWRSQYEITVSLLEDLWNRNLVNIFATPVLFSEWVITLMLSGIFKSIISFAFASAVAFLLYATNIYTLGLSIIPWAGLLIMFGWVFGLFICGVIMRFGTKIQNLAWTSIYLIAPFVGVYYPVSSLPEWAQQISRFVPASYVFEAMRASVMGNPYPLSALIWPFTLCLIYLVIALLILVNSYQHILKRGLISVE